MTMTEDVTIAVNGIVSSAMYVLSSDRFRRSYGPGWGSDTIDDATPEAASEQPINQMQRTMVTLRWGSRAIVGDGPSSAQAGRCRCMLCTMMNGAPASSASTDLPTYGLDPAELRRYVQQYPTRVFDIADGRTCLLASLLTERHGNHDVGVGRAIVTVGATYYRWNTWARVVQDRLLAVRSQWRGADILPVLDAVLAEHGIVIEHEEVAPVVDAHQPPAGIDLAAVAAFVERLVGACTPSVPVEADAPDETVIIAPAWRARQPLVTALDGWPRDHQVADRRPAIAHHLE